MSGVISLLAVGFAFIAGGFYWSIWDEGRQYLDSIIVNSDYYELMYFGWRIIPGIIIIVGVICIVAAGVRTVRARRFVV